MINAMLAYEVIVFYSNFMSLKVLEKLENPSVASVLRDPDQLKDFLIKNGGMSKVQKIHNSVNHFNIGKSYPNYSPYTVNRVAMTGVDI
jgi:hypothetical protein